MGIKLIPGLSEKYVDKFMEAATAIVMDEVTNTDDENKKVIARFTARDMARGAIFMRDRHILTGVGIGVVGTALAFTIGSKFKKKKKDEVIVEFDMDSLNKMEEVLKEQKKTFEEESATTEEVEEKQDDEESIMDKLHDILKKPSNLEDLKAVIEELRKNEK